MLRKKLFAVLSLSFVWLFVFAGCMPDLSISPVSVQKAGNLITGHSPVVSEEEIPEEIPYSFSGELVLGEFDAVLTDEPVPEDTPKDEPVLPSEETEPVVAEEPVPDFWCPDFILYDDTVSGKLVTSVVSYYCMLPENVRTWFQTYGYQIRIMSNINTAYGYSYQIKALTVPYEKMVYIDNRSGSASAVAHEVAHAAAYASESIVYCDTFQTIYAEEVSAFASTFHTHANNYSTIWEYFAEAYEKCILNESSIQAACPKTYEYVMNFMNAL